MGACMHIVAAIKGTNFRHVVVHAIILGLIVTSVLIVWKGMVCFTKIRPRIGVMTTGSMEPSLKRGDMVFLLNGTTPIRVGEIVAFKIDGEKMPVLHRVIEVHESLEMGEVKVLTKGDKNMLDDRFIYAPNQLWLQRHHIIGRVVGMLPYTSWMNIIVMENPYIEYVLIGILSSLLVIRFGF